MLQMQRSQAHLRVDEVLREAQRTSGPKNLTTTNHETVVLHALYAHSAGVSLSCIYSLLIIPSLDFIRMPCPVHVPALTYLLAFFVHGFLTYHHHHHHHQVDEG